MMIGRRTLFVLGACGLLAACVQEPLLTPEQSAELKVRTVTVDVASYTGVRGRQITIPAEKLRADIAAQLNAQLSPDPQGNADVLVAIDDVALVSPAQSAVLGGVSSITGRVQVTEAGTGKTILPATEVVGMATGRIIPGGLPGGVLGAVTTRSPEDDYTNSVASFAADVKQRLFGAQRK